MDAFERYKSSWSKISANLIENSKAQQYLSEGQWFYSQIINLSDGAKVQNLEYPLLAELGRIYAVTIRRYHQLTISASQGFVDLIPDQLRSLTELMFQAYYLLKTSEPERAALDAFNLSAISWSRSGDRLFDSGLLPKPEYSPEVQSAKEFVKNEVFSKYEGRKPRFYADMTAEQTAKLAGLGHVYALSYGMLSAHLHNQPMGQDAKNDQQGLPLLPSENQIDTAFDQLSVATQVFVLTSLGVLSKFACINNLLARDVIVKFAHRYSDSKWGNEIDIICQNLDISM